MRSRSLACMKMHLQSNNKHRQNCTMRQSRTSMPLGANYRAAQLGKMTPACSDGCTPVMVEQHAAELCSSPGCHVGDTCLSPGLVCPLTLQYAYLRYLSYGSKVIWPPLPELSTWVLGPTDAQIACTRHTTG